MQEYFLESRGIAYRTNTLVPGRKTLLFVHGLSGSLSAWDAYTAELEKDFNIISFDLRGHGNSLRPRTFAEYALSFFAQDIEVLLSHLNIGQCHVIAHSFGVLVALHFIHDRPERTESAVFLAAPYRVQETWLRRVHRIAHIARAALDVLPWRPRGKGRIDYRNFGYSPDWSLRRIAPEIYRMGVRSYVRSLVSLYDSKCDSYWSALRLPLLCLHGTKDSFVPFSQAQRLHAELPHAQLLPLSGANHMLVLNNQKEILDAVRLFLR